MAKAADSPGNTSPFERFEALAKKLLSVPKKEVDEKEKERPKRENGNRKPS